MTSITRAGPVVAVPPAVPGAVVAAAAWLVVAVVPALVVLPHDRVVVDATLPVLGWFPLGVAGVLLLDRRPRSPLAWACVAAAATPTAMLLWVVARQGGDLTTSTLRDSVAQLGPWSLATLGLVTVAALWPPGRTARRWGTWVSLSCALTVTAAALAWSSGPPASYAAVSAGGLVAVAAVVATSAFVAVPRPVDEPLLDLLLVLGVVTAAAAAGGVIRLVAQHERVFGADVMGAFGAATTAALAVPGALWVRRELLVRRYGAGVLSADDLAAITADLTVESDPRHLLARAATVVTATSGIRDARIVLDVAASGQGWQARPLVVGEEVVGTLLVRPSHPEGLEARQERAVAQLLPTVALVARAVALAVDAEHARHDVARQREAERARILADLHDDLGPVLAGMSMRVAAARTAHRLPELDLLAEDLASCRSDLRRIVAGLAPAALESGSAAVAIETLVGAFASHGGPEVGLVGSVPDDLATDAAVVLYRTVAEGVTNAVRHAGPTRIDVAVEHDDRSVRLTVTDDGSGGVVVPGIGLTSLGARATELGGRLAVTPATPSGTTLLLELPRPGPRR